MNYRCISIPLNEVESCVIAHMIDITIDIDNAMAVHQSIANEADIAAWYVCLPRLVGHFLSIGAVDAFGRTQVIDWFTDELSNCDIDDKMMDLARGQSVAVTGESVDNLVAAAKRIAQALRVAVAELRLTEPSLFSDSQPNTTAEGMRAALPE